jgi:hypothetical protein
MEHRNASPTASTPPAHPANSAKTTGERTGPVKRTGTASWTGGGLEDESVVTFSFASWSTNYPGNREQKATSKDEEPALPEPTE